MWVLQLIIRMSITWYHIQFQRISIILSVPVVNILLFCIVQSCVEEISNLYVTPFFQPNVLKCRVFPTIHGLRACMYRIKSCRIVEVVAGLATSMLVARSSCGRMVIGGMTARRSASLIQWPSVTSTDVATQQQLPRTWWQQAHGEWSQKLVTSTTTLHSQSKPVVSQN